MSSTMLSRAALGSVASLGDLYDARTDNFLNLSIFNRKIPIETLTLIDNHFSDIHLVHSDLYSDKFSKLDVKADLQLSILSGLFTLHGSGRYLSDQKTSARTVKSSLIYNIKTKKESVNIFHQDLKDAFALAAIELESATHVVVEIEWGANSILSCEYFNADNRDVKEIEGILSAQLQTISFSISGNADVKFNESDHNKDLRFSIHIYGDILPKDKDLPTTFEEALNLMKQIPSLVEKSNEGRGKPVFYGLIPLSVVADNLKFSMKCSRIIKSLEDDVHLRVVHLFENLSRFKQEINDFSQNAAAYRFCIEETDMEKIAKQKKEFAIQEAKLRSDLACKLKAAKIGEAEVSDLENVIEEYESTKLSPDNISAHFKSWSHITKKIAFVKSLTSNGCKYIGSDTSLDGELIKAFESKAYVLYFKNDAITSNTEVWNNHLQIFLQEMKKAIDGNKYFAVDCDLHPDTWPKIGLSIQVLKNGKMLNENLVKDYEATANTAMARCTSRMTRSISKPNGRVNLVIQCTGRNCNPKADYEWICSKCEENIEYGFDNKFYCSCGYGPADSYEFKCTDAKHGLGFECHDDKKYFEDLLSQIRPFKEINILILGETGVGKSTWINGFQNYLKYETIQEAEANELCTLIPSQFTVCDEDFNEIVVSTGDDKNEMFCPGQSATQVPKVYSFIVGDMRIRLIDTPGVGDTRGINQEYKNLENILGTLNYHDQLHGICILLKPNNARLSVTFRFCVKELLTYLHKDASKNIMFCFTNTRGTFYQPGDTMPVLKALLAENPDVGIAISKHTVYCFDSEAYRFLCAIKNQAQPIKFPNEDKENFAKSWDKSISEMHRMLKHILELEPHNIKSTLSLNSARELVHKLTRPLAQISKNIQINININKNDAKEIRMTRENIKALEKKKTFEKIELVPVTIEFPRTVCTHVKCKEYFGKEQGPRQIKYKSICHDRCSLNEVQQETVGDENLLRCACIKNEICTVCDHHVGYHMHINYESYEVKKQVEDEQIKNLLKSNLSAAEIKQQMIDTKQKVIEELQQEMEEVEKASVHFAQFLKKNAITPYNDAMLAYLKHLIREEQNKVDLGGNDATLKSLQRNLESYECKIKLLDDEMKKGDGNVRELTASEVNKLIDDLCRLKHSGEYLKESISTGINSCQQQAAYQEVTGSMVKNNNNNRKIINKEGNTKNTPGMYTQITQTFKKFWMVNQQ